MHQILLILVFLYFLASSVAYEESDHDQGRIIGGSGVGAGKYPFMASLQTKVDKDPSTGKFRGWGHVCGCSILNDNSILTAAHCVTNSSNLEQELDPSDYRVQIGSITLGEGGQLFNASKLIPHKSYAGVQSANNDIAIVKLKKKITFGSGIAKSCLAGEGDEADMSSCKVIGWGKISSGRLAKASKYLLEVSHPMKSMSSSECRIGGGNSKLICAQSPTGGACNGDSGGPYICQVKDKSTFLQFGLVSFGEEDCPIGKASFYTRVSSYINWIKPRAED